MATAVIIELILNMLPPAFHMFDPICVGLDSASSEDCPGDIKKDFPLLNDEWCPDLFEK
jgi:hypothetical protein